MMELNQIRTFVTIAREGSITRASNILCRSQPAISAHVKCMEDMLGITLFERTPRGMVMTFQGEKLLDEAEALLHRHQRFLDNARQLRGQIGGRVALGIGPGMSLGSVSALVQALSEQMPMLHVDVALLSSCRVRYGLRSGSLDVGIFVAEKNAHEGIAMTPICLAQLYVAMSRGNDQVTAKTLPWILPPAGSYRAKFAETYAVEQGLSPQRFLTVDDERLYRELVEQGCGLGFLYDNDACTPRELSASALHLKRVPCVASLQFGHCATRTADPILTMLCDILTGTYPAWSVAA